MVFQYDSIVAVISTTMISFLTAMDILFSFRKKKTKKMGERERERVSEYRVLSYLFKLILHCLNRK
jgi:hypothetical protein